jgi:TonB family protein
MTTPQQFGEYLLFRRLTTDGLGETYRAGKIGSQGIERVVLLRVFNGQGIDADSLWRVIADRTPLHRILQNPHIGDGADVGRVGTTPYVAYEYVSGKNLAELLNQARARAFQIPTEHALFIMERVTFGLSAAYSTRHRERRVQQGFLIPENVLLSNEGEVRLIGFESGPGLRDFLTAAPIREAFGPYLAPEVRPGTAPAPTDDVFSLGSMLYELLTGSRLVHNAEGNYDPLIDEGLLAAEEQPLPPQLRALLKSSLAPKQQRISDVQQWQQAFSRFIAEAEYSPTTFNLAFFMHTLFGGEIEQESADIAREKATQVDIKALTRTRVQEPTPGPSDTVLIPPSRVSQPLEPLADAKRGQYGAAGAKRTNWKVLAPLAILAVAGGLAAAYYMSRGPQEDATLALTEMEEAEAASGGVDLSAASPTATSDLEASVEDAEALPLTVEPGQAMTLTTDTPNRDAAPPAGAVNTSDVDVPATPEEVEEQIRQLVDDRTNVLEAKYQEELDALRAELEQARLAQAGAAAAKAVEGAEPDAPGSPPRRETGQGSAPAEATSKPATTPPGSAPANDTSAAARSQPNVGQPAAQVPNQPALPADKPAEETQAAAAQVVPTPVVPAKPSPPKPVAIGDLVEPGPGVTRPVIVHQAAPRYPPTARALNKTATVNLRILIDENGRVTQVQRVGDAVGFGFDEAAEAAARRTDWKPASKDGVRVKMWIDLRIDFRP